MVSSKCLSGLWLSWLTKLCGWGCYSAILLAFKELSQVPPTPAGWNCNFMFRNAHQSSQFHRLVRIGKELGVTEPSERQGESHLSWLLVQCSFPLFVMSLQPHGLKQLHHQKCHISYDNTVCYVTAVQNRQGEETMSMNHSTPLLAFKEGKAHILQKRTPYGKGTPTNQSKE